MGKWTSCSSSKCEEGIKAERDDGHYRSSIHFTTIFLLGSSLARIDRQGRPVHVSTAPEFLPSHRSATCARAQGATKAATAIDRAGATSYTIRVSKLVRTSQLLSYFLPIIFGKWNASLLWDRVSLKICGVNTEPANG